MATTQVTTQSPEELKATEIVMLVNEVYEQWKAMNKNIRPDQVKPYKDGITNIDLDKLPEYYSGYKEAVTYAENIRNHAVVGRFPEKLFRERSPNQQANEFEYVRKNYKQVTLTIFQDYIATITRGDNSNNWSITFAEDDTGFENERSLQYYIEKEISEVGSLENWRKFILPVIKSIDSNGIICVKPETLNYIETEGEPMLDPEKLLEPQPFYYRSDQVVAKSESYYLIELDERSMVDYGGSKKPLGKIYEYIDENNIYRITQIGKFTEPQWQIELFFAHNEGVMPVIPLMGIPVASSGRVLWQSQFLYVSDILDLVLLNHSNLMLSINTCVYPYAIAAGTACNYQETSGDENGTINRCTDGYIMDWRSGKEKICPSCNGVGLKDRRSPMGVLLWDSGAKYDSNEAATRNDFLKFVSPDVSSLQFLENKIAKDEMKARQIMHLHTSNSVIKGTENLTATGMAIDAQALQAFVKIPSDQIFHIYEFVIDRIGWQRYGESYKKPTIVYPATFEFLTEQDYTLQVAEAIKAGLPPFVIHAIIYRYLKTMFYYEKQTDEVFELITQADRLLTMNSDDISVALARGTVAKWEAVLHDSSVQIVQTLLNENPKFLEQELQAKIEQLQGKAQEVTSAIPSASPGGDIAGKILNIANSAA